MEPSLLPGMTSENPEYEKHRQHILKFMIKQYNELKRQEEAQKKREARMNKTSGYGNNSNRYKKWAED